MKALQTINRILAVAVILWGIAIPVYLVFFAKVSYMSTTGSAPQGEPAVTETVSGTLPWIDSVEPVAVLIMIGLSALLIGGGIAVWKNALAETIILTMLALIGSYVTGFSIGVLYLPGAIALALATLLAGIATRFAPKS